MPHHFLARPETRDNYIDAVLRPSGLSVLLALRHVPKTNDIEVMMQDIDANGYFGDETRAWRIIK